MDKVLRYSANECVRSIFCVIIDVVTFTIHSLWLALPGFYIMLLLSRKSALQAFF